MNPLSTQVGSRSFEIVKRGYDPRSVDRHLRAITAGVEALEDELATANTKIAALEKRIKGDRDADTVVQTAFLAAADAKAKLLDEAQRRADEIIAEAEAQAELIGDGGVGAATGSEAEAMQRKAAEMLDRAKQRLSAAAAEARRIRTQAEQDAEEILVEARRDALTVLREAAGGTVQGGEAREELHRITWMLKNLESAVRDALSHLQATDDRFSVVVLDDANDTSDASAMADVHAGEQGTSR